MRSEWIRRPTLLALAIAATAWFFRFQIASGFAFAFGDRYDAMIEVAILEHWTNVFRGVEAWNVTAYFHPAPDTLGYNDAYFGYGLIYAVARALGCSPVGAAEATHAAMKLIGFFGMFALLRGPCSVRWGWAAFGAVLFTIADMTLQHANHGQLFTVGLAPWAMLAAWRAGEAVWRADRRGVLGWGAALAGLFALWISTAFYLAWFFALFTLAVVVAAILAAGREGRRTLPARLWAVRVPLAAVLGLALVLLVPFLIVYLPKAGETGMHAWRPVRGTTLGPFEYLNPGMHHVIWSPLFAVIRGVAKGVKSNPDLIFGMTPMFLAAALWAMLRVRRALPGTALAAAGVALVACWLLMLNLFGLSPWQIVHAIVPGAGTIRVVGRFQILLLVPATALIVVMLDRARRSGLAALLAALLLVEQAVVSGAPVALDPADQAKLLASVPPPPAQCRAFYVRFARETPRTNPDADRLYPHNVDAMVLAEVHARPTIGGFSSFNPPGWDFADPDAPDYRARALAYAARYGVTGLCELDMRRPVPWVRVGP